MTLADQLRSFPVPPRRVLIAAAGEIERLNLNLVSMQQFTDQIKTECRELRAENERLTAERMKILIGAGELTVERDALRAENERQQEAIDALKQDDIRGGAERDALRQRVTELEARHALTHRALRTTI